MVGSNGSISPSRRGGVDHNGMHRSVQSVRIIHHTRKKVLSILSSVKHCVVSAKCRIVCRQSSAFFKYLFMFEVCLCDSLEGVSIRGSVVVCIYSKDEECRSSSSRVSGWELLNIQAFAFWMKEI